MNENRLSHRVELTVLYLSTFLLRTGFGAAILLFDWLLVWALEIGGYSPTSGFSILLISFAAITYYIAEIALTGYYGSSSDKIGSKPILLYATIGAGVVLLMYAPSSLIFIKISDPLIAIIALTFYLATVHFIHGVFASAKVAPTLGFINNLSTNENRALRMAYYDNAILYGRAAGIMLGGFLWIILKVDEKDGTHDQAIQIAKTFPLLTVLLAVATLLLVIGLKSTEHTGVHRKKFNLKEDVSIAARVMLSEERRPMLLPWLSIAALIGSASLWGPTVSFILSGEESETRGYDALLPLMVVLVGLALPAPFWGMFADRKGRKTTLKVGLYGLPIAGLLGAGIGYPFYKDDISIHNIYFLVSALPGAFMFSALIPVLMGILGDTAEESSDGEVMSGYHFVIALGEIIGVLVGGIFIGGFSLIQSWTGLFGEGEDGTHVAILIGFVLFELILVAGMFIGILRIPENEESPANIQT
ncbi:MAG: MFS transporter [Candidatus Heimdallarchaeota archaeon]|nr:MFS transporter [Candidatus Heimdallarchaeota archaeon]